MGGPQIGLSRGSDDPSLEEKTKCYDILNMISDLDRLFVTTRATEHGLAGVPVA
jgi:hypothetical protein